MSDLDPVTGPPAPATAAPSTGRGLTAEEAAIVAKGLFKPTVDRMVVLTSTLVDATCAGDYALWAPLATMEEALLRLKWDVNRPYDTQKFLAVVTRALRRHAERLELYGQQLALHVAGTPFPTMTEWTQAETLAIYDDVERLYPSPPQEPSA